MKKILINKPGNYSVDLSLVVVGQKMDWLGVIDARKGGEYNLSLVTNHIVPSTFARISIKGVVEGGARVKVRGLVRIGKEAQFSDSFLSMKLLILDSVSSAIVIPEMEIKADKIKAGHSASVSKIDEDQLFYLKSRGIDKVAAKDMIVKGLINY